MKKLPGVMIRVGLILLVFGFFKSTTVETGWGAVHNIGLIEQRNSWLFFGAVIFIGGLLLKNSTSQADTPEDKVEIDKAGRATEADLVHQSKVTIKEQWGILIDHVNRFRDEFMLRFGTALGSSIVMSEVSTVSAIVALISYPAFMYLAMRKVPSKIALKRLFLYAALIAALGLVIGLMNNLQQANYESFAVAPVFLDMLATSIFVIGYFRFRAKTQ